MNKPNEKIRRFSVQAKRHIVTDSELRKLGLPKEVLNVKSVHTLDQLKKNPPNIVIGECAFNQQFSVGAGKIEQFRKGVSYVMPLSVYNTIIKNSPDGRPPMKPSQVVFKNVYRPYMGQNLEGKTLLIWRTGGIGDLLFIKPNIDFLKKRYPTCKIVFGTSGEYHPMVKDWKEVDELINIPFPAKYLFQSHYHITFEGVIERTEQAKYENAYSLFSRWMNLNIHPSYLYPRQKSNSELVRKIKRIFTDEFGLLDGVKSCLVQIRASSPIRTPSISFWKKVFNIIIEMGYHIILTDTPQYSGMIDNLIQKEFGDTYLFHNFAKHSKDISYTIALASMCDLCVGTDSSLIHIAESVETKNFGFFAPFPGDIRVNTYPNGDYINIDKMHCAPCFTHGHSACKFSVNGAATCYDKMDFDLFKEKLENLIER